MKKTDIFSSELYLPHWTLSRKRKWKFPSDWLIFRFILDI